MRKTITLLALSAILLGPTFALAQNVGKSPPPGGNLLTQPAQAQQPVAQPGQAQQLQNHSRGNYGGLPRSSLGAINRNWSERCAQNETIQNVIYNVNDEIRIRLVQTIGTVVTFPEKVTAITSGLGEDSIVVQPFPKTQPNSRIWVMGAKKAGADTNITFVAGANDEQPRFYVFHAQLEGWNTTSCPDVMVKINSAIGSSVNSLAKQAHEEMRFKDGMAGGLKRTAVEQLSLNELSDVEQAQVVAKGAGRQDVDWLKGEVSDPAKLDFRWELGGDLEEADFGPDIVYSDETHMYLQWSPERRKKMLMPAVAVVVTTDQGKVDTPILPTMRGDTMVVPRVANLTLKLEGIVICVVHEDSKSPTKADS